MYNVNGVLMVTIQIDKQNKDSVKPDNSEKFVTVFTDASHCPDTNAWGVAVWVKCVKIDYISNSGV